MNLIEELRSGNPNKERLLKLITDENVSYIDCDGHTLLMHAFMFYGSNPNCDSNILLKLLDMNCMLKRTDYLSNTALMYAFMFYDENFDSEMFLKLLNMDCKPEQVDQNDETALMYAFKYYGQNPICDPNIFVKLILLLRPKIARSKLIELLNMNTNDHNLKNNIMSAYLYNRRRIIINSRISKRVLKGKYDSLSIFN